MSVHIGSVLWVSEEREVQSGTVIVVVSFYHLYKPLQLIIIGFFSLCLLPQSPSHTFCKGYTVPSSSSTWSSGTLPFSILSYIFPLLSSSSYYITCACTY